MSETTEKNFVDLIIQYEQNELQGAELINFFQLLIDMGIVWRLQGTYGRTAKTLIDLGHCSE